MSIILDTLDTRLGARIRVERENRGWSLTDLAERSGVSRAMINKVERGAASPTASLLGRLSGAFGLTLSMLLARTETDHVGRLVRSDEQFQWVDPETGYIRRQIGPGRAAAGRVRYLSGPQLRVGAATHLGHGWLPHLHRRRI